MERDPSPSDPHAGAWDRHFNPFADTWDLPTCPDYSNSPCQYRPPLCFNSNECKCGEYDWTEDPFYMTMLS